MSADDLKRLRAARGQCKGHVTRLDNFLKSLQGTSDPILIQHKIEQLKKTYNEYLELNIEISLLDSSDNDIEEFEAKYFDLLTACKKLLQNYKDDEGCGSGQPRSGGLQRLPRIEIKKFNGEVGKYEPFIQLYNSVIQKDVSLSLCDKFYYLNSFLEGEAYDIVKHLPLTGENYPVALQLLADRYDNKKQLVNHHILSILDLPSMQKTSAQGIRNLISITRQNLAALKNMSVPVQHWDLIIISILQRKIDQYTLRAYHLEKQDSSSLPTLDDFIKFLEQRATALETLGESAHVTSNFNKRRSSLVSTKRPVTCKYCSSHLHKLHQCSTFKLAEPAKRKDFVKSNNLCQICLNNHDDKKCFYSFKCSFCKGKHNTLLHEEIPQNKHKTEQLQGTTGQVSLLASVSDNVLLPTIKVKLFDINGQPFYVRALLDSGSQVSFILSEVAVQMGCKLQHVNTLVSGVCDGSNKFTQQTTLNIYSAINNYNLPVTCHVTNNITCNMPQFLIKNEKLHLPSHIKLADDNFYVCDKISMLLGCDIFFQILLRDQLPIIPGELFLQNTSFGYVIAGKVPGHFSGASTTCLASNFCSKQPTLLDHSYNTSFNNLEKAVSQFWQVEKVPEFYNEANSEHELAEKIFQNSVVLNNDRFEVELPLKQDISSLHLGDSLSRAVIRFKNLELRFKKNDILYEKYKAFIEEYIELGHAKYVDISDYNLDEQAVFFLPHHPVFNDNSPTTKLRVVFDASMQSSAKIALNDVLLNGRVVQNDLFSILILFRLFKYIINCDIQKMFRQVRVAPSHCPLQNILWRRSPTSEIQCIQLLTVTYGQKSSSYLATRCLVELVNLYKEQYPLAADVLLHKTYIDDINITSNDKNELLKTRNQLIDLLKKGGFTLHKWCTNQESLLEGIPSDCQYKGDVHFSDKNDPIVRALGIKCKLDNDTLIISSPKEELLKNYTKRDVLSFVGRIFDPLGLVGPIVVTAKLLMQRTWLASCDWDSSLPADLQKDFRAFTDNLNKMSSITVQRNLNTLDVKSIDIIGFSDASNKAYGCCLYLRTVDKNNRVSVDLLCSKSRVNPVQQLSTPRLELNSALLLAKLAKKVYDIIKNRFNVNLYLYVDSQVVLAWLKTNPLKLSVYVANRIKNICELVGDFSWYYVNTSENPADCLSRGVEPCLLQNNNLWWHGPSFLKELNFLDKKVEIKMPKEIPELKTSHLVYKQEYLPLFSKFSDFNKIKRIIAYVYRFVGNCVSKKEHRLTGNLTPQELDHSLKSILRCEQKKYFYQEYDCVIKIAPIKSNLKSLVPFIDDMGLMRVGGRLQNADIPYSQRYPIILPKGSDIVHSIIRNEHIALLHAGPRLVLTNLSQRFHIVNGIREVKHVLHKCLTCFKLKARASQQLMGSLPSDRVNPCRIFEKVGIDYGGPFNVKMCRVRKPMIYKSYILLFVCFISKAVHVELVTNLTTECFLNALKRFIARRNKPLIIYCDNASTFKGAQNQLHDLYELQSSTDHKNKVEMFSADLGITFKFIPAYSPVFGGLWEAGIKSVKHHIKRVVGNAVLTYEELNTVIIQIEGILNSRPLTALPTANSNEMSYLTPGHFLTGAPLTSYPEGDHTTVPVNRLRFWQQCTQMVQNFWKQWSKVYLVSLQNRPKWHSVNQNIRVGSLVIVRDDNVTPLRWPMARVVDVFPGADGKVRALSIRTSTGSIVRTSIHKVCLLPVESE